MIPDDDAPINVVDALPPNQDNEREDDPEADGGDDDDESDYSYTYDDDDDGHYSGFLIPTEPVATPAVAVVAEDAPSPAAAVEPTPNAAAAVSNTTSATPSSASTAPRIENKTKKWMEPTRQAVTMSLRAERETSGGRRRLASDLYKIMASSTVDAGFTLEPACEDSMDKWTIKLFGFDQDSNLAKDLLVCNLECVQLEMSFPAQYPFEPPFVRVVSPRFVRQTGFVMNGALCMELLTKDGWNPINDIESVIVSIRSLMVVGDGRVQAAVEMDALKYEEALRRGLQRLKVKEEQSEEGDEEEESSLKRKRSDSNPKNDTKEDAPSSSGKKASVGSYSASEAISAYDHLSKFHQEKGWDKSGWWAKRG